MLGVWRWDLVFCQFSLNSVQPFHRRNRKCEKLTATDGRTTDRRMDGRRRMTDNAWSLRLRCTKIITFDKGSVVWLRINPVKICMLILCPMSDIRLLQVSLVIYRKYKLPMLVWDGEKMLLYKCEWLYVYQLDTNNGKYCCYISVDSREVFLSSLNYCIINIGCNIELLNDNGRYTLAIPFVWNLFSYHCILIRSWYAHKLNVRWTLMKNYLTLLQNTFL